MDVLQILIQIQEIGQQQEISPRRLNLGQRFSEAFIRNKVEYNIPFPSSIFPVFPYLCLLNILQVFATKLLITCGRNI